MLTIFVRSVILFAAAVLVMRAMGKRQVGQMQPYELVVAVMIAELAATPVGGAGVPLLYGIAPMLALMICHGIITALCMRFERFRAWVDGQPTVLIRNGVICEKQMRKMSITLTDLMEALRTAGMLDPSEVGTAVLETGGQVSVFPKASSRPVTPEDLGMKPSKDGLPLPLILDGRIQSRNLQSGQMNEAWLMETLRQAGFERAEDVLFMCMNTHGQALIQGKGCDSTQTLQLMSPDKVVW